MNEDDRITRLERLLRAPAPGVTVGIGDDAAVLAPDLVWTIDEQVEHIHFRRDLLTLEDLGWRSLMAAASDIAAMGADPWCALASIVAPADVDLEAIARGQAEAARMLGAPIVGGNLSRGDAISIATTVLGKAGRPILRSGARSGDGLFLSGSLGLAAAGLRALEEMKEGLEAAVIAWRRPVARIDAGRLMRGKATAAIDVSDGLALDLHRLARSSSVRLVLDESALRSACVTLDAVARGLGLDDPLDLALQGGEDYALVCTSPVPIPSFSCVGRVESGSGVVLLKGSTRMPLKPRGWEHFQ
jgi:thiamine-monophosphate kinase